MLSVHLDGYLNVLDAALPIMAAAGHGRILGVTSGSGWRPADTGAYGCAKRAVASLTWQLGRQAPPGVVVNAMSPIAATRMVTAALGRARPADRQRQRAPRLTGGLSLASMPTPEELGPLGAHLVDDDFSWCSGQVIFAGGSEVAVIDQPRLLEVVRTDDVDVAGPRPRRGHHRGAVAGRGRARPPTGGATPASARLRRRRHGRARRDSACDRPAPWSSDRAAVAAGLTAALEPRAGDLHHRRQPAGSASGFAATAGARSQRSRPSAGPLDAVVVAPARAGSAATRPDGWEARPRRARRHRRRAPRRRGLGPGGRRPRRQRGARRAARDAHRRHHRRRPQPSAGRRAARPVGAGRHRGSRGGRRGQRRDGVGASTRRDSPARRATSLCSPEAARSPAPSWWSAPGGSACAATRGPIGSITFGGPAIPPGSTTRSAASSARSAR